ncbi:hypothetical protein ACFQPA_18225 [Halomarina halobia]|uniref:Uncharacterized protein n=1 Tax=Halomarina halobia TaxID=3033386 RepID=A0ABD6ADJ1_9EURY|nr:hypothetical protein [Halomarina sp. PSR21]
MAGLPHVIDIRDDLERAREASDEDVSEELAAVEERVEAYSDRSRDREGLLDDIDNELLRLEERADGIAEERLRAARNRIHLLRDSLSTAADGVTVLESKVRRADAGASFDEDVRDEQTEFWLTLVNSAEPRTVGVELAFYAEDGDEVGRVSGGDVSIDADEQKTVTVVAEVPDGTDYYVARVADADELTG